MKAVLVSERSIDRSDWRIEIVRTPRESCADKLRIRNRLRDMLPDNYHAENIGGYIVRRTEVQRPDCYRIGSYRLRYEDALAVIEGRKVLALPETLFQLPSPIEEAS